MQPLSHELDTTSYLKYYILIILVAIFAGIGTGYLLASKNSNFHINSPVISSNNSLLPSASASVAPALCRDVAEGKITAKSTNDYSEGTHYLTLSNGDKASLTSAQVDISKYEGKTVKVCGESQKAAKTGWLIDVYQVTEK